MVAVKPDAPLEPGWNAVPVLWAAFSGQAAARIETDCSDAALAPYLGPGRGIKLRSFGHDEDGVHFLITRAGTPLHRDPAYARYSHQLVLRNDGNRIRGLPAYDCEEVWHPPLAPGVFYCLDTHSPHQGCKDYRMDPAALVRKVVIAVDRDEAMTPGEAYPLLCRLLAVQLADVAGESAVTGAAPRFPGTIRG